MRPSCSCLHAHKLFYLRYKGKILSERNSYNVSFKIDKVCLNFCVNLVNVECQIHENCSSTGTKYDFANIVLWRFELLANF